jgi:hypothetical protein
MSQNRPNACEIAPKPTSLRSDYVGDGLDVSSGVDAVYPPYLIRISEEEEHWLSLLAKCPQLQGSRRLHSSITDFRGLFPRWVASAYTYFAVRS